MSHYSEKVRWTLDASGIPYREVEQRFDAIGKDVARCLYAHIVQLWAAHASPWQAAAIRLSYPVMHWVFRHKLVIHPARVALPAPAPGLRWPGLPGRHARRFGRLGRAPGHGWVRRLCDQHRGHMRGGVLRTRV